MPRPIRPAPLSTTGIGSLPHTQLELAMQTAFQVDVPYAPQLPRQNPAEFMIPQALEGLPGLEFDDDGGTQIDFDRWRAGAADFGKALERALDGGDAARFEPTAAAYRAWKPFLWEVEHRKLALAKAQLAGPLTVRWAVKLGDGRRVADVPELDVQCHRLVLARLLAMARAVRAAGAVPIVFIDEPGLCAVDRAEPRHVVMLQELKLAALALKKEGALVGLHCCGDTDWAAVLGLGLDYVSIDARLSLAHVVERRAELDAHMGAGGCLALGIVPTNFGATWSVPALAAETAEALESRRDALAQALLTPACGLALRAVPEAETVFSDLKAVQRALRERVGGQAR